MPVKVKCSNCEKVLSVPDAARGKAVKCPGCDTRIAVPAESKTGKPTSAGAKPKPKKPAAPIDTEEELADLDISRAADPNARICVKCGYDMQYQEEDDTECPQCGHDSTIGGLGVKARKKAMRGPDPADFFPGLVAQSWKFVVKNYVLAWRTVGYSLASLTIALCMLFLYLYLSMWPTRIFLAFCFCVSFLVIPGWMWFLNMEIIKLTAERKDKFKKLNFDFFLSSGLGVAAVSWFMVFASPMILLPAALGYFFVDRIGGNAIIVLPICLVIGLLPTIWMFPIVIAHMTMPIQYKAWMVWKIVPLSTKNVKPLLLWMLWAIITNIPIIAGISTIAAVYGSDLVNIVTIMEDNAEIARQKFAAYENPNMKKKAEPQVKKKVEPEKPKIKLEDPKDVDFKPVIVPVVILFSMCIVNGFTALFNMRVIGQFVYYHKSTLELIDKKKEYKYVAKERIDEDAVEEKPKTPVQLIAEGLVFYLIFDLFGFISGMIYSSGEQTGQAEAIFVGIAIGHSLSLVALYFQCISYAFFSGVGWAALTAFTFPIGFIVYAYKDLQERKDMLVKVAVGFSICLIMAFIALIMYLSPSKPKVEPPPPPPVRHRHAEPELRETDKNAEVGNDASVINLEKNTPAEPQSK